MRQKWRKGFDVSFYNPLPVTMLLDLFNLKDDPDFVKSDYCQDCGGIGQIDNEQCESCEDLHNQELQADRFQDELKGN